MHEMFQRLTREKEKDSKAVKRLELQLKAVQDSMVNLTLQYEKLEAKVTLEDQLIRNVARVVTGHFFII